MRPSPATPTLRGVAPSEERDGADVLDVVAGRRCSGRTGCTPRGRARRTTCWRRRPGSDAAARCVGVSSAVAGGVTAELAEAVAAPRPASASRASGRARPCAPARRRGAACRRPSRRAPADGTRPARPRMPSTWTRQVRHAPSGGRSGSLQSCGSGRPRRLTPSRTVAPAGTSTARPSMVRRSVAGVVIVVIAGLVRQEIARRPRSARRTRRGTRRVPTARRRARAWPSPQSEASWMTSARAFTRPTPSCPSRGRRAARPAWRGDAPSPRDTACTCRTIHAY